jgi:hypothetical protein
MNTAERVMSYLEAEFDKFTIDPSGSGARTAGAEA